MPDIRVRTSVSGSILFFAPRCSAAAAHNVHEPAVHAVLRLNNAGSALCLACHIK